MIVFFERTTVAAVRSTDGGTTFAPRERVAPFKFHVYSSRPGHLRAPPVPTVAVDRTGTVYAAWYDCRFRHSCAGNDIVLARSSRAGVWSKPIRIPLGPARRSTDYILPASAVPSLASSTAHARLSHSPARDCFWGSACAWWRPGSW